MAIAEWPATLPNEFLLDALKESHPKMIVRTSMDKGPAKVRRLTSKKQRPVSLRFFLTSSEVETFETFVSDTLAEGVYRFSWTHPRTGTSSEFRFVPVGEVLYDIEAVDGEFYEIGCKLEILP